MVTHPLERTLNLISKNGINLALHQTYEIRIPLIAAAEVEATHRGLAKKESMKKSGQEKRKIPHMLDFSTIGSVA
ncbi:hypothetical protein [Ralstonia pseudosolanacearum]|uniref:hypothetical protein n=1 Tax=Ralstonia pseudosolanacearum TaxID=1310165 RepID=UPI003AAEB15F